MLPLPLQLAIRRNPARSGVGMAVVWRAKTGWPSGPCPAMWYVVCSVGDCALLSSMLTGGCGRGLPDFFPDEPGSRRVSLALAFAP